MGVAEALASAVLALLVEVGGAGAAGLEARLRERVLRQRLLEHLRARSTVFEVMARSLGKLRIG